MCADSKREKKSGDGKKKRKNYTKAERKTTTDFDAASCVRVHTDAHGFLETKQRPAPYRRYVRRKKEEGFFSKISISTDSKRLTASGYVSASAERALPFRGRLSRFD